MSKSRLIKMVEDLYGPQAYPKWTRGITSSDPCGGLKLGWFVEEDLYGPQAYPKWTRGITSSDPCGGLKLRWFVENVRLHVGQRHLGANLAEAIEEMDNRLLVRDMRLFEAQERAAGLTN